MTHPTYPAFRRAAVLSNFGSADNFLVREIRTPLLRSDEMLVRVKSTSVNPIECKMRQGLNLPVPKPVWRLLLGRPMILGIDFSGTVVATGSRIHEFQAGDDVMGAFRFNGADAEYVMIRPSDRHTAVARKPPSISYADAAAVPPGIALFVFVDEESVVQLNSIGPRSITYVNPQDDPRTH